MLHSSLNCQGGRALRLLLIGVSLLCAGVASAQTVHKCVGPDGRVTFTQGACAGQQRGEAYEVRNPPPGGDGAAVPLGSPGALSPPAPRRADPRDRVTVVGERISPCAKYVGKSPVGGATADSIRREYGRPDRVRTYNGQEDWVWYETSRRPYRSVDFDENGCATSLYESQSGRRR